MISAVSDNKNFVLAQWSNVISFEGKSALESFLENCVSGVFCSYLSVKHSHNGVMCKMHWKQR